MLGYPYCPLLAGRQFGPPGENDARVIFLQQIGGDAVSNSANSASDDVHAPFAKRIRDRLTQRSGDPPFLPAAIPPVCNCESGARHLNLIQDLPCNDLLCDSIEGLWGKLDIDQATPSAR